MMIAEAHFYFVRRVLENLRPLERGKVVELGPGNLVWLTAVVSLILADMPEANALCNVLGPGANLFCRDCSIHKDDIGNKDDSVIALAFNARVDQEIRRDIDQITKMKADGHSVTSMYVVAQFMFMMMLISLQLYPSHIVSGSQFSRQSPLCFALILILILILTLVNALFFFCSFQMFQIQRGSRNRGWRPWCSYFANI